jgi:phosphatidylglycerol:prolipoprotein diacylglycerol transferase
MYPILIRFGPLTIYSYGLWITIGFFAALILILREAKQENLSSSIILDLIFWIVIFGIIGARLGYIIYDLSYFLEHPFEILAFWKGGLVFYGGLFLGFIAGLIYIYYYRLNFWQLADLVSPGLALAEAFGRIGCFFAGC